MYPIGAVINSLLLIGLIYLLVSIHRRVKRIERLVTPEHTDERGVRYYPPHTEVVAEETDSELADRIRALRAKRKHELEEMEH